MNNISKYIIAFLSISLIILVACDSDTEDESTFARETKQEPECILDWQCSVWSECSQSGTQTRTCTDKNNCGVLTSKPTESQSCISPVIDSKIEQCSNGFSLDDKDTSFITNTPICKPEIMNMVASDNPDDYFGDSLSFIEKTWDNWKDYQPLVDKVRELTAGKTNDIEKVEAIANWVYKSKTYQCPELYTDCSSPANNREDFSTIFDSSEGVCLDAAIITSAMLRVAGIPSAPMMVGFNHIITMYYIDGLWYTIDTTFCLKNSYCNELNFMSPDDVKEKIFFLYNKKGHFNENGQQDTIGNYCENDFCMRHPFVTNKIMPLNDKSEEATVIYPSIKRTYVDNDMLVQVFCSLEFKNMICDDYGCFFSSSYDDNWNKVIWIVYEIEDMRNIGYSEVKLPAKMKFLDSGTDEKETVDYRFACKQSVPDYRLIAYKEFTLPPGGMAIITYEDLQKSNDATVDEFNKIKDAIKSTTVDLGIIPS